MPRPSIKSPCTADHYADKSKERIAEFSAAKTEAGGLISLTEREDGLHLSVYQTTGTVVHASPDILGPQTLRAAAKRWAEQNPAKSPDIFAEGEQSRLVDILLTAIENVETLPLGKGYNGSHVSALKETARAIRKSRTKPEPADDARRLIKEHGPVVLTCEPDGATGSVVELARFATIADAEAYLNTSASIDPDQLAAGCYGIDAPHGLGSDDEAIPLAEKLGFEVFMSMGGAYYAKRPKDPRCHGWVGKNPGSAQSFDNVVEAAHAANKTIEP